MHSQKQSTFPAITEILCRANGTFLFCPLSVAADFVTVETIYYDPSVDLVVVSDSEACCSPSLFSILFLFDFCVNSNNSSISLSDLPSVFETRKYTKKQLHRQTHE
jgi:hypothetical protein